MNRENRYIVIKRKDAEKHLSQGELDTLHILADQVADGREYDQKPPLNCVVVESDWPEYESTWAAIAARVDGSAQPVPADEADGEESKVDPAVFHAQEILEVIMGAPVEELSTDVEEVADYIRTKMKLASAPIPPSAPAEEQIEALRSALRECDKQRLQLIEGCVHADIEIGAFRDEYFDQDPPEGSLGIPEYRKLNELQAHLSGTCIDDNGEYMDRDQFQHLLARTHGGKGT